ncbi:hypothetical protein PoB_000382800 [Plakobranchus ocellatus]|uniref:Uncharacterized protein n=1 Tax=Plakobranchus ocellatus TaxID=259542 RepID=A0AAV3Y4L5_9GAST|nr:hypothetical protein PoB_000382800 [Plakobranchus ocellatus]
MGRRRRKRRRGCNGEKKSTRGGGEKKEEEEEDEDEEEEGKEKEVEEKEEEMVAEEEEEEEEEEPRPAGQEWPCVTGRPARQACKKPDSCCANEMYKLKRIVEAMKLQEDRTARSKQDSESATPDCQILSFSFAQI